MANLIEGLLQEMNRVREIAQVYEEYPAGFIAASLMKNDIKQAEQFIADGDVVAMVDCCRKLKEYTL